MSHEACISGEAPRFPESAGLQTSRQLTPTISGITLEPKEKALRSTGAGGKSSTWFLPERLIKPRLCCSANAMKPQPTVLPRQHISAGPLSQATSAQPIPYYSSSQRDALRVILERRLILHRYCSQAYIALRVMFISGHPCPRINSRPVALSGIHCCKSHFGAKQKDV